jgi:hypothetical protein
VLTVLRLPSWRRPRGPRGILNGVFYPDAKVDEVLADRSRRSEAGSRDREVRSVNSAWAQNSKMAPAVLSEGRSTPGCSGGRPDGLSRIWASSPRRGPGNKASFTTAEQLRHDAHRGAVAPFADRRPGASSPPVRGPDGPEQRDLSPRSISVPSARSMIAGLKFGQDPGGPALARRAVGTRRLQGRRLRRRRCGANRPRANDAQEKRVGSPKDVPELSRRTITLAPRRFGKP